MSGFALGSAFDSKSGQMIMVALLLMVGAFYAVTLFGNNGPIYVSELPSNSSSSSPSSFSTGISTYTSKVAITYRKTPLLIPETGMNVCPLTFNEYIPCHNVSYIKSFLPNLDVSRKEELERHCPPLEKRLFCLIPPPED